MNPTAVTVRRIEGDDSIDAPCPTAALRRAETVADLLDRAFRLPGTQVRFGLDSLVGLIPVVGDTATTLVGLYPVMEGLRFQIPRRTISKMLVNLGIDWLIGLIPVVDLVFDVAYKANLKNVELLKADLAKLNPPPIIEG